MKMLLSDYIGERHTLHTWYSLLNEIYLTDTQDLSYMREKLFFKAVESDYCKMELTFLMKYMRVYPTEITIYSTYNRMDGINFSIPSISIENYDTTYNLNGSAMSRLDEIRDKKLLELDLTQYLNEIMDKKYITLTKEMCDDFYEFNECAMNFKEFLSSLDEEIYFKLYDASIEKKIQKEQMDLKKKYEDSIEIYGDLCKN